MGAQLDRLRYEVFQNLFYSPMNIGFLRPAVATAPTVYGIETQFFLSFVLTFLKLQQHLPFTVLKRKDIKYFLSIIYLLQQHLPFTVLKPSDE